jgi:hypothetical protein
VSNRPCPNCGLPLIENARFCGQCGTTISAASAPVDVHEEVTVARAKPDLAAMRTLMDAGPFGGDAAPPPPAGNPTPLVPAPETQSRPPAGPYAVDPPRDAPAEHHPLAKTQMLSQTMNDPEAEERARQMLASALGSAATAQAPPVAPKANLNKTMLMGGEPTPAPVAPAAPAPAPAHVHEASPLSHSVLAPNSWHPPALTPDPPAPAPAAAAAAAAAQGQARAGAPALRTMMGMPASALGVPPSGSSPAAPQAQARAAPHNAQKTMLGVAIPGIAPTHGAGAGAGGGAPPAAPPAGAGESSPMSGSNPLSLQSKQSTMLGVAIPGIAPTHASSGGGHGATVQMPQSMPVNPPQQAPRMPSQVQNTALGVMAPPDLKIVPRPKTLIDADVALPLPIAPEVPQKKGIPAVALVGILFVIVAIAGGGIAFFALRNSGTLSAVPQLDENGRESLKIGCTSCPDGTTVALGASTATVTAGAAVLPLPAPLSIGDNDLTVKIERPAGGRHEDVKVHVPVAYRVRADLATLTAKPPAITVRIEATPGSVVTVEEKPITLDPTGRGSYAIDLSKETEGTGEAKTFERKIPFAITPKGGKAESGELTARTTIVPLALDAPGRELFTDKGSAAVAGQTRPGTAVTIDGQPVPVDAQGKFGVRVELTAVGEKPLEIVAAAPPLAPRIAKVKVTRVASLADAAKGEDAQNPVGYDVFGAEPATKVGQKAVVEGEVVEARATAGHTVLLIEDKKKCAKGASCLVRVVHGEDDKAARGDTVRAYGRVLGSVTASGKTVPDIEATLVLPLKAAK